MAYRWTLTHIADVSSAIVLEKDPIGWDDCVLKLSRDPFYHGVFIDYSLSLKFHCDGGGKQFIDGVYQSDDINGNIEVLIEYACDGGTYEELYTGKLNLASYMTDGEFTICNIERSDLHTKMLSRSDILVNLSTTESIGGASISGVPSYDIPLTSVVISAENEWTDIGESGVYTANFAGVYGGVKQDTLKRLGAFIDISNTPNHQTTITQPPTTFTDVFLDPIFTFETNDFIPTGSSFTVEWDYNGAIELFMTVPFGNTYDIVGSATFVIAIGKDINSASNIDIFTASWNVTNAITVNEPVVEAGNTSIVIYYGDSVWCYWRIDNDLQLNTGGSFGSPQTQILTEFFDSSSLKIKIDSVFETTNCNSFLAHEALGQVIDAIADSDGNFYSEFYGRTDSAKQNYLSDGCGSLIAITNGMRIRTFDTPFTCSFKELYDVFNCIHNIGMAIIDGVVRIEPLNYWYQNAEIISLSIGVKVELKNDNTRYINSIGIGYLKWESEFKGGLDDPCGKHNYSTIINSAKNKYEKLSSFIASPYSIEVSRRKNKAYFPDTDWRHDKDSFIIALIRDGYVSFLPELYDDSFSNGSGMESLTTAYNLRLTPSRMLLAHLNVITAGLQTIQGDIKFIKGEGNTTLAVNQDDIGCPENYSGENLAESQSFTWNDANAMNITPLWQPEIYRFEYPITYAEFKTIRANPHGYISVTDDHNNVLKGFILNMEYKMKSGLTTFELLKMFEA